MSITSSFDIGSERYSSYRNSKTKILFKCEVADNLSTMEPENPSMFLPMNDFGASTSINSFNMDLLMSTIVNNDKLVRSYQEKCAELSQIQLNLQSITETANQIRQMYTHEKERKDQLQTENEELIAKLNQVQVSLEAVESQCINNDTVNKQSIAALEVASQKSDQKYLDLCSSFVEQAKILHVNNLSTPPLTRKCSTVKEILFTNGIFFDWNTSPQKQQPQRKSTIEKAKTKTTRTYGTQTNVIDPKSTPKPILCDKGTQYQQSKATRSTCTSAFIHTTEMATNTDDFEPENNSDVESVLHSMVSTYPTLLSPIHETSSDKVSNSTQTPANVHRDQETVTDLQNVDVDINYTAPLEGALERALSRCRAKTECPCEVKRERCHHDSPPCFCIPNYCNATKSQNVDLAEKFQYVWQIAGDLLFQLTDYQNARFDEKHPNNYQIIEKYNEIYNYFVKHAMNPKPMETDVDKNDLINNISCNDDDHSRDSMESYNSAKVVVSQIRNLSSCSPLPEESLNGAITESNQTVFKPIELEGRDEIPFVEQENGHDETPLPRASQSDATSQSVKQTQNLRKEPSVVNKKLSKKPCNPPNEINQTSTVTPTNTQISRPNEDQTNDEAHFKKPKRKSSITDFNARSKKRKTIKVSKMCNEINVPKANLNFDFQTKPQDHLNREQNQTKENLFENIFGSMSDDEDSQDGNIRKILDSVRIPQMLSPIKDWAVESSRSPSPPSPMELYKNSVQTKTNVEPTGSIRVEKEEHSIVTQNEHLNAICESIEKSQEMKLPLEASRKVTRRQPSPMEQSRPIAQNESCQPAEEVICTEPEEPNHIPVSIEMPEIENITDLDTSAREVECQTTESTSDFIDDFSPASPKPDDEQFTVLPPQIPLNTINTETKQPIDDVCESSLISTESPIDRIIYDYVPSYRNEVMMLTTRPSNAECYLLASLRNAIERYCSAQEWSTDAVTDCIEKMLNLSRQPKHLATSILEVVQDTKEELSTEFTPPAPGLQSSHQRCLVLMSRLSQIMPSFDQYVQYELERRLFTFLKVKSIDSMINLAHFYVALIDIEQPSDFTKIRLFIYKCLYYFKTSAVPLVFTVIMAHPYALPHANLVEFNNDPLIRAIVSTLSNIIYTETSEKEQHFKKTEMFHTLKRRYGFFADKNFSFDVIVDYCMECINANRLQHVDYALILIAKRKDYEYTVKNIIEKHLIPMLQQLFAMNLNTNTESDSKICKLLFTIGSIVKTFPIEQNINSFLNIFVTCLNATQRQIIQEAAIMAICQMNRFGTAQIYKHLATWKPNYEISPNIHAILKTIVYRKTKQFWFDGENVNEKKVMKNN